MKRLISSLVVTFVLREDAFDDVLVVRPVVHDDDPVAHAEELKYHRWGEPLKAQLMWARGGRIINLLRPTTGEKNYRERIFLIAKRLHRFR